MVTRNFEKRADELMKALGPRGLRELALYAEDLTNLSISDSFDRASDPITGNKWKRRKKAYRHRPLQKTGALRSGTRAKYKLTGNKIDIMVDIRGSASEYGWYHQTGTSRLPRRRFIGFSPKYRQRLSSRIRKLVK